MHTYFRLLIGLLLVVGLTPIAYAQNMQGGDKGDTNNGAPIVVMDSVAQKDKDTYDRLDLSQRFGVQFKPHKDVCDRGSDTHCDARVVTDNTGAPNATPKVVTGFGPLQLRKAYGLTGVASGAPIIAIVDAYDDPNIASDLAVYSNTYGLPQLPACQGSVANSKVACFQKVDQRGSTRYPTKDAGWALETSLDVETAHAMCQNCRVLLVEADSASFSNLTTAVDRAVALGAKIISNSYGGSEFSGETAFDSHFNKPGVSFVFSSGDGGYGVEYPAASPYVTAVGGTSLFLNADGSYDQELAWSGSGSGCSILEPKPTWQKDGGCAHRTVADVSADADPSTGVAVYDSVRYSGASGWFQVGGTSLAAPIIAATYALGAPVASNVMASSLPYAAPSTLHDIISGTNGSCGTYLCNAGVGFDGPTGLGSPIGTAAF